MADLQLPKRPDPAVVMRTGDVWPKHRSKRRRRTRRPVLQAIAAKSWWGRG